MKQTFSELVKNELCRKDYNLTFIKGFLRSYLLNNLMQEYHEGQGYLWKIQTHFAFLARFLIKCLKDLYDLKNLQIASNHPKNMQIRKEFSISFIANFQQIQTDLELDQPLALEQFSDDHKKAFIVGAFLSRGSVSDPTRKNYHLEFVSDSEIYTKFIQQILIYFGIEKLQIILRNRRYVLYLKRSEAIADVLKLMNTIETLFKYEDLRIGRDFTNNIQRLNNLDISNLRKSINSLSETIVLVKKLKKHEKYQTLPKKIKIFCEIIMSGDELTLSIIAKKMSLALQTTVSKSGVAHLKNKIRDLCHEL